METKNNPINIFDFDGTLTTETWPKFWVWVKKFGYSGEKRNDNLENALAEYRKTHRGDALETFFGFFNDLLIENNESLTYEELMDGEKYIKYNPGVKEFLENSSAKNYIVSGGLKEFLEKLEIARNFEAIYGTPLIHNQNGMITGIGSVMTDDRKIHAIKQILNQNGNQNNDCSNVYYIGDGYSDAIAMEFVHNNGGKTIFVHQPNKNDGLFNHINKIYEELNKNGIVDYRCVADYRDGKILSKLLKRRRINDVRKTTKM